MGIVVVHITAPVPACFRVRWLIPAGGRLWVKNDQTVGIRPGIIACFIDETPVAGVLFAAMERNMSGIQSRLHVPSERRHNRSLRGSRSLDRLVDYRQFGQS